MGALVLGGETPAQAGLDCASNPSTCFPVQPLPTYTTTPLSGWIAPAAGADFNRCVPDAGNVVSRLNARGDVMGIHHQAAGYTDLEGTTWHTQGIQRLPFYPGDPVLQGNWFVATFSHPRGSGADDGAHLGVANLSFSAAGKGGLQIGSNRMFNRNWVEVEAEKYVTPHPGDTFVPVNGTPKFHLDNQQNHPGGLQTFGWHGAIPLQGFIRDWWALGLAHKTPDDSEPRVELYDFKNPNFPVRTSSFRTHRSGNAYDAQSAAVARLADGRFVLAVVTSGIGVELWISKSSDSSDPFLFGQDFRDHDAVVTGYSWDSMSFLTDCTGKLFLMGFSGSDKIDLLSLELTQRNYDNGTRGYVASYSLRDSKTMYCSDSSDQDHCDFEAGTGAYVDPQGRVIVYSTVHDNQGITLPAPGRPWPTAVHGNGAPWWQDNVVSSAAQTGFLPMVEFHERARSGVCNNLSDAWVEFYADANFNDYGRSNGKYYRIDYDVRDAKNNNNLDTHFFNNRTSSIRYCIPKGHSFRVYRDQWSGSTQWINGLGRVAEIKDLRVASYTDGTNMDESITSYHFHEFFEQPNGLVGTLP